MRHSLRDAIRAPWPPPGTAAVPAAALPDRHGRTLALALLASLACHALLVSGWRWQPVAPDATLPAMLTGSGSALRNDAPLHVELVSVRGADAGAVVRAPEAMVGTAKDTIAAPAPAAPAVPRTPPRVPEPPPFDWSGVVNVADTDDIGAADSAFAADIAVEFPVQVATRPQLQQPLTAAYPQGELQRGRKRTVGVLVIVDAEGRVERARKNYEDDVYAPAIDAALREAQFTPALDNGRPVRFWTVLVFDFTIFGSPVFP